MNRRQRWASIMKNGGQNLMTLSLHVLKLYTLYCSISVLFVLNRLFIYFSDKIYHRNCYTAVLCFRLIWGYFVTQTIVVNFLNQHKIVDFFSLHIVYSTISRKRKCSPYKLSMLRIPKKGKNCKVCKKRIYCTLISLLIKFYHVQRCMWFKSYCTGGVRNQRILLVGTMSLTHSLR